MNEQPKQALPATIAGGKVGAIIPRSVEEIWRVATMVNSAGLAPEALIKGKSGNDAVSAIAIAIMSGAEMGLPPMLSLRSFTVINGRPALYGDGLYAVVRRSGKAEYIRGGCEKLDGQMVGFCEAKRSDTGEASRVEFSQADAVRAGLWDEREKVQRYKKGGGGTYEAKNDAPWHRYPQRMLQWRAAGFLCRELFADTFAGIPTDDEALEIEDRGQTIESHASAGPPPAPAAPDPVDEGEGESEPRDVEAFLSGLESALAGANSEETVIEAWDAEDVEAVLTDDEDALQRAFDMKKARLAQIDAESEQEAIDEIAEDGLKPASMDPDAADRKRQEG